MRPRATIIRRSKTYSVVIDRGRDPRTGKRQRDWYSGYQTKADAERARTKLLRDLDTGSYVDPSAQTVAHYLRSGSQPANRRASAARAGTAARSASTPGPRCATKSSRTCVLHGAVRMQDVTIETLDSLYDELEESGGRRGQGLAPQTVLHVHRMRHKAFNDAIRRGTMIRNPAASVDPPRAGRAELSVWTAEQLQTFLAAVRDHEVYAAWPLSATTGMRRGEVAGLARGAPDLERGRRRVQWTLGVVDANATWKRRPKTKAGERVIALDPATVDALRAHLARQAQHRLVIGERWPSRQTDCRVEARHDPVFTWPDGTIINPDRYTAWFTAQARCSWSTRRAT